MGRCFVARRLIAGRVAAQDAHFLICVCPAPIGHRLTVLFYKHGKLDHAVCMPQALTPEVPQLPFPALRS
jgi:hypothetical protein